MFICINKLHKELDMDKLKDNFIQHQFNNAIKQKKKID